MAVVHTLTTHPLQRAEEESSDWDWWCDVDDKQTSAELYLALEMVHYVQQMDHVKDMRCKQLKIMRANEPTRYNARCPECEQATFDIWFAPSTLEVKQVQCASKECCGVCHLDVPSGYVRAAQKMIMPVDNAEVTQTAQVKRKRGRPVGSKNKKGTKKSRLMAAQLACKAEAAAY